MVTTTVLNYIVQLKEYILNQNQIRILRKNYIHQNMSKTRLKIYILIQKLFTNYNVNKIYTYKMFYNIVCVCVCLLYKKCSRKNIAYYSSKIEVKENYQITIISNLCETKR